MNKKNLPDKQSGFILDTGNDGKVKNKKLQIRNSTVEFLIFTKQNNKNTIGVRIEDETVWLTQKLMSVLFEKGRSTITGHLQNIFETGELKEISVCRDFRHTAELMLGRANSNKEHRGLITWKNAPHGKIIKPDVSIKNYLSEKKIKALDRITTMYLDYAEDQAEQNIPMTMEDWSKKLNVFLQFNNRELLDNPGKVAQEIAKAFAESELGKYRIVQDRLFESDFDKMVKKLENNSEGKV